MIHLSKNPKKKIIKADFTKIKLLPIYMQNKKWKDIHQDVNSAHPLVLELQRIFSSICLFILFLVYSRNTDYFCNGKENVVSYVYLHVVSVYQILSDTAWRNSA